MEQRVLVVEDIREIAQELGKWISRIELKNEDSICIDYAETREEALQKILDRTYHVAVLDIMLTDSEADRSGLQVLSKIHEQNEGTLSIIMSGASDHLVPRDAFRLGVIDYFDKAKDLRNPEEWTEKVKEGIYRSRLSLWGHQHSLLHFLALPERPEPFWVYNLSDALGISISMLKELLEYAFDRFAPVLPRTSETSILRIDSGSVYGEFWSKGLGVPVAICLRGQQGKLITPSINCSELSILKKKKNECDIATWNISSGAPRHAFDSSIFDRRYVKSPDEE